MVDVVWPGKVLVPRKDDVALPGHEVYTPATQAHHEIRITRRARFRAHRMADAPKPVAAVITEWRTNSHADVLLTRLLEPEKWGHEGPYRLKLVALYADQF